MMLKRQSLNWALGSLFLLLILLLAGCGSNTNTSQSAQATQGPCPPQSLVKGTIQSVSTSSFTITTQTGTRAQVTYTSKTPFLRQSRTTIQSIQVGSIVQVGVNQKNDKSLQATTIEMKHLGTIPSGGSFPGGPITILQPGNGTPPGGLPGGGPGNGTPPAGLPGGPPQGGPILGGVCILTPPDINAGHPTVNGTVKQVSGNQLTITDLNHKDHTITITNDTQVISEDAVTPKALQTGMPVAINATRDSKGNLGALLVTILLN